MSKEKENKEIIVDKMWDIWEKLNDLAYKYHDKKELNSGQYSYERSKLFNQICSLFLLAGRVKSKNIKRKEAI